MSISVVDYKSSKAAKDFVDSLKNTGFGVLTNHPLDKQLIDVVYTEWDAFFHSEDKHRFLFDPNYQDGFFPFGTENAKGMDVKDLKEFYHVYTWGRIPSGLKVNTMQMFDDLVALATTLLGWIDDHTPDSITNPLSTPLRNMLNDSTRNLFRIIHYPPLTGEEDPNAIRAAAHEDINLITVLASATAAGLQAQDRNGNWYDVPCDPGTIAVNVGDMLQMCTNEYYPSTTHRVVNPDDENRSSARLSMPMFLHPRDDVQLSTEMTAKQYLDERLREIGLKK